MIKVWKVEEGGSLGGREEREDEMGGVEGGRKGEKHDPGARFSCKDRKTTIKITIIDAKVIKKQFL